MFDRPEILSNLNFVYESRHSLALHEYLQRGQQEFFFIAFCSTCYQTLISDIETFTLACLLFDRPEILSNQSCVHESRRSLARHQYFQRGQQQFFIIVFFSIRYQTLISEINTFHLPLFIVSLKYSKVLFTKAVVL